MTVMTRWRVYILLVLLAIVFAIVFAAFLLRKRGVRITLVQELLFIAGALLIAETIIISGLSNFNLGVILPAFFGVPLVLIAILLPYMHTGVLCVLKWAAITGYVLAGLIFLVCGTLMLSAQRDAKTASCDAVIVLGAAVHGDRVTWVLSNRLDRAIAYLEAHPDAICVVSGGQGAGESVTEGYAMRTYMIERGIGESRVFSEEKAVNTSENFAFSKEIIDRELGPGASIAFVTTDFHVFRAGRVAASLGIDAVGIPAEDVWYLKLNNFMRESVGISVYWLTGRI